MGAHVAWGESSAIAYVNSVLGARTNREGGPTALAAAICGRVPEYGLHLDKNRKAKRHVHVAIPLKTDKDFAVLGYFVGGSVGQDVSVITGIDIQPSMENLKTMSAAVASSGAVALFHIVGVTPEAPTYDAVAEDGKELPTITFGKEEYKKICDKFNYSGKIDFVVIGCPHASINELNYAAKRLKGKRLKADLWLCTSRQIKALADEMGIVKIVEEAGGEIVCDTCPVLCPTLVERQYKSIATNSAKMAHYAPGLWNLQPVLLTEEQCIKAALAGQWEEI